MLSPFKKIQPQIYNVSNNNISNINDVPDDYDFYENEKRHMQKIQNKIINLKNEKLLKLEEQCTFSPKINSTYKIPRNRYHTKSDINISHSNQNFNNSQQTENDTSFLTRYHNKNTFEKLYNDSSMNKIKKEERIKKYLEEFKFTPNIEGNEKYPIKSSFEQRRKSSIDARAKFRNKKLQEEMDKKKQINNRKAKFDEKEIVNRLYGKEIKKIEEKRKSEKKIKEKEEKKKHVIDWNKVYKNYYEKYPEGDDYKRHLEKRRKFMESANNINKNKEKEKEKENNVMEFNDFLKQKELNNNVDNNTEENKNDIKDDIKTNEEINNKEIEKEKDINKEKDEESNNKNENTEQVTVNEVKSAINDVYKSKSLKNLLGENNIFKKED
jgi:DnaJ family protein A protein 5